MRTSGPQERTSIKLKKEPKVHKLVTELNSVKYPESQLKCFSDGDGLRSLWSQAWG